jgi:hypothetical protein
MISDNENRVLEAIRQCGPLEAYRGLIAENNALIQGPDLKNGRAITTMRTAIHTVLAGQWAEEQQRMLSYDKPFALVALGGTGREEVTPCSDLDFAFLFDDALEGNALLLELQRQMLHTSRFQERHGFSCIALPFGVDDMPSLVGKQLNSFLDMRPVFDPAVWRIASGSGYRPPLIPSKVQANGVSFLVFRRRSRDGSRALARTIAAGGQGQRNDARSTLIPLPPSSRATPDVRPPSDLFTAARKFHQRQRCN